MLNIEKVKSMTKAAAYESGQGKKNLEMQDSFCYTSPIKKSKE